MTPSFEFLITTLTSTGTDHDGVMSDIRTNVAETFNNWFGTKHTPEEIRSWHTVKNWGLVYGLKEADSEAVERRLWFSADILFNAKPMPGAVEFMKRVYELGIKIPIISSRPSNLKDSTIGWYQKYMPFVDIKTINIGLPDLHQGLTKPWMILRSSGQPLSLFLEDSPDHARDILANTEANIILVSNDGSLDHYLGDRLFRVSTKNDKLPDLWPVYNAFFGKRQ